MKTKNTILFAALAVVVCAGGWKIAAELAGADDTQPAPAPIAVTQPVAPVVVSPAANFDLEVTSPADVTSDQPVDLSLEMPTPELTWYDPHGLKEVGGIS